MIENISSNKMQLQLRFVLKNKDLKSMVRRINLKLILFNQLKCTLGKLFRILHGWYQPTQLYEIIAAQVSFFLICMCHAKAWITHLFLN